MNMLSILFSLALSVFLTPNPAGLVAGDWVTVEQLPAIAERMPVFSPGTDAVPAHTATAVGVWDPMFRTMLYGESITTPHPIASITKLMTALLILESGTPLENVLTITPQDNDPEGTRLPVAAGAQLSVRDLLFASLIASDNNATEALVRATGHSEAAFVGDMNDRAAALGMTGTRFTDVTGLGSTNVSTVHDLALLTDVAFRQPLIREATTSSSATVENKADGSRLTIANTDKLLGSGLHIVAGKTGYTVAAGGTLALRVRGIGERETTVIVLGSTNRESRFSEAHAFADWVFGHTTWPAGL